MGGMSAVFGKIGQVRIQNAKARYDEDKIHIMSDVAPGVAIDDYEGLCSAAEPYNANIKKLIQDWFADTASVRFRQKGWASVLVLKIRV